MYTCMHFLLENCLGESLPEYPPFSFLHHPTTLSLSFFFFLLPFDTPPPFRTQPRYTTPDPSPPIVAHTQREGRWEGWLHKNKFSTKLVSLTFLLVATGGSFFLLLHLFSILCFFFFQFHFSTFFRYAHSCESVFLLDI